MKITIEIDDEKLRRTLRWMKRGLVLSAAVGAVAAIAQSVPSLVSFVPGQPVRASELNANFSALKGEIDAQASVAASLPGRAGGQVLNGGTGPGDSLKLESTADAAKGQILLASGGGNVGIGVDTAGNALSVGGGLTVDANGTGAAPIRFGSDTSADTLGVDASHNLSVSLDGQNRLTLSPTGAAQLATGLDIGQQATGTHPGRLHLGGSGSELSIADRAVSTFIDMPASGERWSIYDASGRLHFWSGRDVLVVAPNGDVQTVGRLTASQFGGDGSQLGGVVHTGESVRIVRGFFGGGTPSPVTGTGYSVQHVSSGVYKVVFSPAFADFPSVTASTFLDNSGAVYVNQSNSCNPLSPPCDHVELHTTTGMDMNIAFIAIGK